MKSSNEYALFESLYPADSWSTEIKTLLSWVEKGQSGQLLGLPGVGKYLVLGLLAYNKKVRLEHLGQAQKSYQFVYVDFSEIRSRPLADVMKMLFLALADSLRDRGLQEEYEKVNHFLHSAIELGDELVLTEELKHALEYLVYEKQMKVIYLLDRFEEYVPSVSNMFFANLRLLRNRAKYSFSVIFSVNKPLEDLLEQEIFRDFADLMVGNTLYLPLLDRPSLDFRLEHLEKITGKNLTEDVKQKLLDITGGHGKLMRLGAESVLATGKETVDADFLLAQQVVVKALAEIWLSLSPSEQEYLLSAKTDGAVGEAGKARDYLRAVHLLAGDTLEIPLLAAYIQTEKVTEHTGEKIVFDAEARKIRKGELVLSDDLTSSEYRLLSFLAQREGEILERDMLIQAVWGDNASTQGVTDQALDQLLFRLRRKIELDPASPRHILTVKGRGFKFIP